jgi:transcriptional regulator with XRE-family HTH domain
LPNIKAITYRKDLYKEDLIALTGVHYSQIGRYEKKGITPSADITPKISNTLGVFLIFLMSGSSDNLADSSLTDKELLNQFKAF